MANEQIKIEVIATGGNTFKIVSAAAKELNSELDKTAKAHNRAAKESDLHTNTQAKGAMGAGSAGRDFGKLARSIDGGSGSLVGAYATLAANIFAVSAAFNALKGAAQLQQLQEGIDRMGNRMGITLSNTAHQVRDLSGGMLNLEQSFRATAQAAAGGIKSDDIKRLTVLAKDASYALGRDMPDSMDRLTKGVLKLEPELLDELGIMTRLDTSNRVYAASLGKTVTSLSAVEKQTGFLNAAASEGELKFKGLSDSASSTGFAKLAAAFTDLTNNSLKFINTVAEPLASLLSNTPGGLAGLTLIFASTISKQLVPGLKNMTIEAAAASEATSKLAAKQALNLRGTGEASNAMKRLSANYATGGADAAAFKNTLDEITKSIDTNKKALETGVYPKGGSEEKTSKVLQKNISDYEKLKVVTIAVAEAEKNEASLAAQVAISKGKLSETSKQLNAATAASAIILEVETAALGGLSVAGKKAAFSLETVGRAAKTAGVAIMEALNIIGLIVAALFMLYDAAKWAYEALAGKELLEAQKNLAEVQKHVTERTVEYNRIQEQAASASTRQALTAKLVTNNIKEQVEAVNKLATANARTKAAPLKASIDPDAQAVQTLFSGSIKSIQGNMKDAELSRAATKQLKALAESNIPEYNIAIERAAGSTENFNKIVESGDATAQVTLLNSILDKTSDYDSVISGVDESIKGLNKSYSEFVKSITPTTPYDGVIKSLMETGDALNNAQISMKNGIVDAKKLSNILSSLDMSTVATMSIGADAADVTSVKEMVKATEDLNAKTQIKNDIVAKGGTVSKKIADDLAKAVTAQSDAAIKGVPAYNRMNTAAAEHLMSLQKAAIINSSDLTVTQARLSLLGQFNSLTGEGAAARIDAENHIKELQAQQLDAQSAIAKLQIISNNTLLDESKALVKNKEEYTKIKNIVQDTLKLKTEDRMGEVNKAIRTGKDSKGATLNKGQLDELSSLSAEYQKQYDLIKKNELAQLTINSLSAAAAAIRSTEDTAKIKAAKSLQEKAAGTLQLAQSELKTKQDAINLATKQLTLEDTISGVVVTGAEAYDRIADSQAKTKVERLAVLKAETQSQIATLNVQIEIGLRLKKNVQGYRDLVKALKDQLGTAQQILDVDDRTARLAALNLKTIEETNNTKLNNLNTELDLMNKIASASDSVLKDSIATAALDRRAQGLPELSTFEKGKQEKQLASEALKNAMAIRDIKVAIINMEFILLRAKLEAAKIDAAGTNERIQKEMDALDKKSPSYGKEYDALKNRMIDPAQIDRAIDLIDKAKDGLVSAIDAEIGRKRAEKRDAGSITSEYGPDIKLPNKGEAPKNAAQTLLKDVNLTPLSTTLSQPTGPTQEIPAESGTPEVAVTAKDKGVAATGALNDYRYALEQATTAMDPLLKGFQAMGPEGEFGAVASAGIMSIQKATAGLAASIPNLINGFKDISKEVKTGGFMNMLQGDAFASFAKGAQEALSTASSVLGAVGAIYAASSKQKIAGIDKEIAAEQKRDGKSAESIAKIKALESKKEAMAKKAFEVNKKIMIAQAVMSTASAVVGALAARPWGLWNIPIAVMMGAMGAAQIAMIAGTSYGGGAASVATPSGPSALTIGKRSDSVDLAKSNVNAGGESGFISGSQGTGSSASTFRRAAYGDNNTGRAGFIVGEKGPELFTPSVPGSITPNDKMSQGQPVNATINIHAIDSAGIEELLTDKRGHIIGMLREAANANGQKFLESVDTKKYSQGGRRL